MSISKETILQFEITTLGVFDVWYGVFGIWDSAHLDRMGVTVAGWWTEAVSVHCRLVHQLLLLSCTQHPHPNLTPVAYMDIWMPEVICPDKLTIFSDIYILDAQYARNGVIFFPS